MRGSVSIAIEKLTSTMAEELVAGNVHLVGFDGVLV